MFRSLPTRALLVAALPALLLAPSAFAAGPAGESAGKVHYSDHGVMLSGGTGKTMAAEVIANTIDR